MPPDCARNATQTCIAILVRTTGAALASLASIAVLVLPSRACSAALSAGLILVSSRRTQRAGSSSYIEIAAVGGVPWATRAESRIIARSRAAINIVARVRRDGTTPARPPVSARTRVCSASAMRTTIHIIAVRGCRLACAARVSSTTCARERIQAVCAVPMAIAILISALIDVSFAIAACKPFRAGAVVAAD